MIKRSIIKKQMAKRISAAVLAATLCVSACPNSVVGQEATEIETVETTEAETVVEESQAEATEEAVAEEPQAETTETEAVVEENQTESAVEEPQEVATTSEDDLNPPVIEAISFTEKGQTVAGNDELHIQITAYDLEEGSEFLPKDIFIDIGWDMHSAGTGAKEVNALGNNQYEIVFDFVGNVIGEEAREKCTITHIRVRDTSGNETIVAVSDFSEEEWTFALTEALNEEIQIKEIKLEKTDAKLTDEVFRDNISVELKAEGNLEGVSYIVLEYQTEDEDRLYAYCYYDEETQSFKGEIGVSYYEEAGAYKLVRVDANGIKIPCDIVSEVTVVKANKDVTGPIVEDFYFKHNGKEFENGSTVKSTDTLEFYVKIKDESELQHINVQFGTYCDNVGWDNGLDETFVKNENEEWEKTEDGYYKAVFDLAKAYPTEWYMTHFELYDIYQNYSYISEDNFSDNYLYVERNGECVRPEFTYNVYVEGIGDERIEKEVTTGRLTSLKELFPEGMPKAPEKEGRKFVGWYVEAGKEEMITSEDTTIIANRYGNIWIEPIYDKVDIRFAIQYCNEAGKRMWEEIKKTVDYTTTYGELTKMVDLAQYKHWNEVTFEGWDSYYFGNEEIADEVVLTDTYVSAEAIYDKAVVSIYVGYYDEKGHWQNADEVLAVKKGMTYKELIALFEASELGTIKHYEDAVFQKWEYSEWILESLEEEISDYESFYPRAVYTNEDFTPEEDTTPEEETLDIKITDIKVSNKNIVLTDDNRYEDITLAVSFEGEDVASIQNAIHSYIWIQPKDEKDYDGVYSLNTIYNTQKKQLEATFRVSGNMQSVDYVVRNVLISFEAGYSTDFINTYTGDKTLFSVTKKTTDQEAPIINAVQIYVNNTLQKTGTITLKKGDVITVRADVDDKSKVSGIFYFMNDNTSFYGQMNPSAYDLEGKVTCNGTTVPEGTFHIYYVGVSDWYGNQMYYYEEDVIALYKEVKPNPQNATLIGNKTTSEKLEAIGKNIKDAMNVKGAVSEQTKANVENALKNGYTIKPEISVSSVPANSVQSDVKAEIQEKADAIFGDNTKVAYLDISLNLLANGTTLGTLNKLAEPISITVKLPEALKGDYNYKVIRYHVNADGTTETEILDATKNADGTITFKTDRFSTYAIAYSTNTAKSPITGQTGMTTIYLAFAVSAIAVVYSKKRIY